MISLNSDNRSQKIQALEDFKKNHSDMEHELKRRLQSIRKKNIRLFLKQINAL